MANYREFVSLKISLASPEEIRSWSHGEVKKPETINYRSLKPEKDGLFCEKIFGPVKDWECHCGKYKGKKHAGMICDKCGVEITRSIVRRERMGHIELAAPVSHIWYFKGIPSPMSLLLNITTKELEKVLYFASTRKREQLYKVKKAPLSSDLREGDILTESEYNIYKKYDVEVEAERAYQISLVPELSIKVGDVLSQEEYESLKEKYGIFFRATPQTVGAEIGVSVGDVISEDQYTNLVEEHEGDFEVEKLEGEDGFVVTAVKGVKTYKVVWVFSPSNEWDLIAESEVDFYRTNFGGETELAVRTIEESSYIVINPGQSGYNRGEIILESVHRLLTKYDPEYKGGIGAEAIKELLASIDLEELARTLRKQIRNTKGQKNRKLVKRLQIVEAFRKSGNKPEWMILEVLPVIPPDLRPMVQLDGGRFATSDLNDLYRRVINRNSRLKKLIDMGAPDIIIKNEKRMLQEAVDALIENGRRGRAVLASGNRPLKSLSDILKGKKGRFRQNLLGKRVDYSGRSVIVVGPELKFHQCGLPKRMALELFKPFVIKELVKEGFAHNIKSAKRMIDNATPEVWDVLERVTKNHPVLLNRAPTLHRLGIQAFEPILVEGNAIKIHPLVCTAFNADFDGDQIAVHVPLSFEARAESRLLMLASNNILSPASGKPLAVPTQDVVLGIYYLTYSPYKTEEEILKHAKRIYGSSDEAILAYQSETLNKEEGLSRVQEPIKVKIGGKIRGTTIGRLLFNEVFPEDFEFYNDIVKKSTLEKLITKMYSEYGNSKTVEVLDKLKDLGFEFSTLSGISIGIGDLEIPSNKENIIAEAEKKVEAINVRFAAGMLTQDEKEQEVSVIWGEASKKVGDAILENLGEQNSLFIMADSGARGSKDQISQLAGMRGLMADTTGRIIEFPIKASFREGLSVLEYFYSTHGARKGLADTALRTAKSGYLTRRLVDVSQDLIVREEDCGVQEGIVVTDLMNDGAVVEKLRDRIIGRTSVERILDPETGEIIVDAGEEITEEKADRIEKVGIKEVKIRSVLTCKTKYGVCAKCYGRDLATGRLVNVGEAVGIIAAQSIGEPGTQLTLRTFHTGGVRRAEGDITYGLPQVEQLFEARRPPNQAILADAEGEVVDIKKDEKRAKIYVKLDKDGIQTYVVPKEMMNKIIVKVGDRVKRGDYLTKGDASPKDILRILGVRAVQEYLLSKIQSIYRSQGVIINDKHIEIIIRQIARLNKIYIREAGDTELLSGELVYTTDFEAENEKITKKNVKIERANLELLKGNRVVQRIVEGEEGGKVIAEEDIEIDLDLAKLIIDSDVKVVYLEDKNKFPFIVYKGNSLFIKEVAGGILDKPVVIDLGGQGENSKKVVFDRGTLLTPEILEDMVDSEIQSLTLIDEKMIEKLSGFTLAEDLVDLETGELLGKAGERITPDIIENIKLSNVPVVKVWEGVETISLKDKLIRMLREEILGAPLGGPVEIPGNGKVLGAAGKQITRNMIREFVTHGVEEIPLSDGRFFSIEGRALEFLYKDVVGKTVVQDVVDAVTGEVVVKAQDVIKKEDAEKIVKAKIDFIRLKTTRTKIGTRIIRKRVGYIRNKLTPAEGKPIVQGITKASLLTDSFLSSASFQRTTHVLTDAAIKGKVDYLLGLKENVIIGKVIPAGTGLRKYQKLKLKKKLPKVDVENIWEENIEKSLTEKEDI